MRTFLACLVLAAALLAPGLAVGPSLDAAVFAEVAHRVREGATLYVDVWDHKPPGIYLLLTAGQVLLPFLAPWNVSWLLSVVATAGVATLLFGICRRLGMNPVACWLSATSALLVMGQYLMALGGGLTEPFAAVLLAMALGMALEARPQGAPIRAAATGALVSLALLLSVQAAPAAVPLAWLLIVGGRGAARRLTWGVIGGAIPLLAVVVWMAATGSLDGALDAVVRYTGAYRAVAAATGAALGGPVMAWTLLALLFLVMPAAMGVVEARHRGGLSRELAHACVAWIALALASFLVQGRLFGHYVIPLAVPLALLAGFGVERVRALSRPERGRLLLPAVATCLISALAAGVAGAMELNLVAPDHDRSVTAATAVRENSAETDRIWVWGNEPQLYLDSGRSSTTPYPYLYALVTPGYTTPEQVQAMLEALQADPPAMIVDAGSPTPGAPGFQPLLIDRPVASDGRDLDLLEPLRDFVRGRYREVDRSGGWVVYALGDSTADALGIGSSQRRETATRR
ncbi:MAG TPA: hypothetical protein VFK61_08770 [Candidatus Limnocylindria bacterium]|nr:hypothetical protein [Candidatus Limnocylindria bacterium]